LAPKQVDPFSLLKKQIHSVYLDRVFSHPDLLNEYPLQVFLLANTPSWVTKKIKVFINFTARLAATQFSPFVAETEAGETRVESDQGKGSSVEAETAQHS
jgi:hypothetical protein